MFKHKMKTTYLFKLLTLFLIPGMLASCMSRQTPTPFDEAYYEGNENYVPYDAKTISCVEKEGKLILTYSGEQPVNDYRLQIRHSVAYCVITVYFIFGGSDKNSEQNEIFQAGAPAFLTLGNADEIDYVQYFSSDTETLPDGKHVMTEPTDYYMLWPETTETEG